MGNTLHHGCGLEKYVSIYHKPNNNSHILLPNLITTYISPAYPKYAIGIAMGFGVGHFIHKFKVQRIAEREVYLFDYVNKHPEDFPEIMG